MESWSLSNGYSKINRISNSNCWRSSRNGGVLMDKLAQLKLMQRIWQNSIGSKYEAKAHLRLKRVLAKIK